MNVPFLLDVCFCHHATDLYRALTHLIRGILVNLYGDGGAIDGGVQKIVLSVHLQIGAIRRGDSDFLGFTLDGYLYICCG